MRRVRPVAPRPMLMLRDRRAWLGLAISIAALWLAMRGIDARALLDALSHGRYVWLLPAVLVVVIGQAVRALRWRMLFGDGPLPSFADTFWIICIGYLVSTVLPLRLGDPTRAWLIETRTPAGGAEALAAVVAERVLDLVTIAALLALWSPQPAARLLEAELGAGWWSSADHLRWAAIGFAAAAYGGVAVLGRLTALVATLAANAARLAARLPGVRIAPRRAAEVMHTQVTRFGGAFGALSRPRSAVLAVCASIIVWGLGALSYWLVMPAVHLTPSVTLAIFAMGAAALFAIVPSSPGYIGVFHAAIVAALWILADVPREVALGYAIVLHAVTFSDAHCPWVGRHVGDGAPLGRPPAARRELDGLAARVTRARLPSPWTTQRNPDGRCRYAPRGHDRPPEATQASPAPRR